MEEKNNRQWHLALSLLYLLAAFLLVAGSVTYAWFEIHSVNLPVGTDIPGFDASVALAHWTKPDPENSDDMAYVTIENGKIDMERIGFNQMEVYRVTVTNRETAPLRVNFCYDSFAAADILDPQILFFTLTVYTTDPVGGAGTAAEESKRLVKLTGQENWLDTPLTIPSATDSDHPGTGILYFAYANIDYNVIVDEYTSVRNAFEGNAAYVGNPNCETFLGYIGDIENNGYPTDSNDNIIKHTYTGDTPAMTADMDELYTLACAYNYIMFDRRWPVSDESAEPGGWIGFGRLDVPRINVLVERDVPPVNP